MDAWNFSPWQASLLVGVATLTIKMPSIYRYLRVW